MRVLWMAAAVLVTNALASAQEPAPQTLKLTLTADKAKVALGQEIQFEVRLENAGDKDADVSELVFEERSFSLSVIWISAAVTRTSIVGTSCRCIRRNARPGSLNTLQSPGFTDF